MMFVKRMSLFDLFSRFTFVSAFLLVSVSSVAFAQQWEAGENAFHQCVPVHVEVPRPDGTLSQLMDASNQDYTIWCPVGTLLMSGGVNCDDRYNGVNEHTQQYLIQKASPVVCVGDRCTDNEKDSLGNLPGMIKEGQTGSRSGFINGTSIARYGISGRCKVAGSADSKIAIPFTIHARCCPYGQGLPQRDQCYFSYSWDAGLKACKANSNHRIIYSGVEVGSGEVIRSVFAQWSLPSSEWNPSLTDPTTALKQGAPTELETLYLPGGESSIRRAYTQTICCDVSSSGLLFLGDDHGGLVKPIHWRVYKPDGSGSFEIEQGFDWVEKSPIGHCQSPSFPMNLMAQCDDGWALNSFYYHNIQAAAIAFCSPPTNAKLAQSIRPARIYAQCPAIRSPSRCPSTLSGSFWFPTLNGRPGYSLFSPVANSPSNNYYPGAIATAETYEQCRQDFTIRWMSYPDHIVTVAQNGGGQMQNFHHYVSASQRFVFVWLSTGFLIRTEEGGKCLEVAGDINTHLTPVRFADCDPTKSSQAWLMEAGSIVVRDSAAVPRTCLDVYTGDKTFDKDVLIIATCMGGNQNQFFSFAGAVTEFRLQWQYGRYLALNENARIVMNSQDQYTWKNDQIRSAKAGKCLEVSGGAIDTISTPIILNECDAGKSSQRFVRRGTMIRIKDATLPGSAKCLHYNEVDSGLIVHECTESWIYQHFTMDPINMNAIVLHWTPNADHVLSVGPPIRSAPIFGTYYSAQMRRLDVPANQRFFFNGEQIQSMDSSRCMQVIEQWTSWGSAPVQFKECNPSNSAQKWAVDGSRIVSKQFNKCLDVDNGNVKFGVDTLVVWNCYGGPNQAFVITPIDKEAYSNNGVMRTVYDHVKCEYDGKGSGATAPTSWQAGISSSRCYRRNDRDWNDKLMCSDAGKVLGTPILDPQGKIPYSCVCDQGYQLSESRDSCVPKCGDSVITGGEQCDGSAFCTNQCRIKPLFSLKAPAWNQLVIDNVKPNFDPASTSYTTPVDYEVQVKFTDQDVPESFFKLSQLSQKTLFFNEKMYAGGRFEVTLRPVFHSSLNVPDQQRIISNVVSQVLPCSCDPINNPNGYPLLSVVQGNQRKLLAADWMADFVVTVTPQWKCAQTIALSVKGSNENSFENFDTLTASFEKICTDASYTITSTQGKTKASSYNDGIPGAEVLFTAQSLKMNARETESLLSPSVSFVTQYIARIQGKAMTATSRTPVDGVSLVFQPLDTKGNPIESMAFVTKTISDGSYDMIIVDDSRRLRRAVTFEIKPSYTANGFAHVFKADETRCAVCQNSFSTRGCCSVSVDVFTTPTIHTYDSSSFTIQGAIVFKPELFGSSSPTKCASVGTTIRAVDRSGAYILDSNNKPMEAVIQRPTSDSSIGSYQLTFAIGSIVKLQIFNQGVARNHSYAFTSTDQNWGSQKLLPAKYSQDQTTERALIDPTSEFIFIDKDYTSINFFDTTTSLLSLKMPLGNCGETLPAAIPLNINGDWCNSKAEPLLYESESQVLPAMVLRTDFSKAKCNIDLDPNTELIKCKEIISDIGKQIAGGASVDQSIDLSDVARFKPLVVTTLPYYVEPQLDATNAGNGGDVDFVGGVELHNYCSKALRETGNCNTASAIPFFGVRMLGSYSIIVNVKENYIRGPSCAKSSAMVRVFDRVSFNRNPCFYGCPNGDGERLFPTFTEFGLTKFRYNFSALSPVMNGEEGNENGQVIPPHSQSIEFVVMGSNAGFKRYNDWSKGGIRLHFVTKGITQTYERDQNGKVIPRDSFPLPSPVKPFAVIRKPPGDMSSATITSERAFQFETRVEVMTTEGMYRDLKLAAGVDNDGEMCAGGGLGVITLVCSKVFKTRTVFGTHVAVDEQRGNTWAENVVRWSSYSSQSITTGDRADVVGKAGDIYVMQSLIIQFIKSVQISVEPLRKDDGTAIVGFSLPSSAPQITWQPEDNSKPATTFISRGEVDKLMKDFADELKVATENNNAEDAKMYQKLIASYQNVIDYVDAAEANAVPYHDYITRYLDPKKPVQTNISSINVQPAKVSDRSQTPNMDNWESKSRFTFYGGGSKVKMAYSVSDSIVTHNEAVYDKTETEGGISQSETTVGNVAWNHDVDAGYKFHVTSNAITDTEDQTTYAVEYEFGDANIGDHFDVEVMVDLVFRTPVFRVISGRSSCPSVPGTIPRHQISLTAKQNILSHLSPDRHAAFAMEVTNTGELQKYILQYSLSGLNKGMKIYMGGAPLASKPEFDFPPNGAVTPLVIEIGKGPFLWDYVTDVTILPACEDEFVEVRGTNLISDTETLTAHFVHQCVGVEVESDFIKDGEWSYDREARIAQSKDDSGIGVPYIPITLSNPERDSRSWYTERNGTLKQIIVEYRLKGTYAWKAMEECGKDAKGGDIGVAFDPTSRLHDEKTNRITFNWYAPTFTAEYEIRARTVCSPPSGLDANEARQYTNAFSPVYPGVIDVEPPRVFQTEPADRKWRPGLPLSIAFNENILCDDARVTGKTALYTVDVARRGSAELAENFTVHQGGDVIKMEFMCMENKMIFAFELSDFAKLTDFIGTEIRLNVNFVRDVARNPIPFGEVSLIFVIDQFNFASTPVTLQNVRIAAIHFEEVTASTREKVIINQIQQEVIALLTPVLRTRLARTVFVSSSSVTIINPRSAGGSLMVDIRFSESSSIDPISLASAFCFGLASRAATPESFQLLSSTIYDPQTMVATFETNTDNQKTPMNEKQPTIRSDNLPSIVSWELIAVVHLLLVLVLFIGYRIYYQNQKTDGPKKNVDVDIERNQVIQV